ncbi:hypothetical protein BKA69DRAFT_1090924 [Paraphysoderma sedebokerense]|nr:hypothetical protein BKA69DRAFT_1090924 [Paraphysoderma sedebokerense]
MLLFWFMLLNLNSIVMFDVVSMCYVFRTYFTLGNFNNQSFATQSSYSILILHQVIQICSSAFASLSRILFQM